MALGIPQLRQSIDSLDQQILELISKRLELVMKVGDVKRSLGLAVHDPAREHDMLERVAAATTPPLTPAVAQRIFRCIIAESRALEQRHVSELGPPRDGITADGITADGVTASDSNGRESG